MKFIYLNFFLILFIFLLSQIKSQENQDSQNKLKEIEYNISQINSLYQNLTERMQEVQYNFILKLRYKSLTRKKEKAEKMLNDIKLSSSPSENSLEELNEYVSRYKRSCKKMSKLYDTFEDLKKTVINIIKIFFLTFIITVILVIIISSAIYYYIVRKRRNYDVLQEEMSHSDFRNSYDTELETIKKKKNKKKIFKKKKKAKIYEENKDSKEKVGKKTENIEVLDDK